MPTNILLKFQNFIRNIYRVQARPSLVKRNKEPVRIDHSQNQSIVW